MSQQILVTGAGGFVGSAIAEALVGAGRSVLAIDMALDVPTRDRLASARMIEAPLPGGLDGLSDAAPDAVVHAAAITADPAGLKMTRARHIHDNTALLLDMLDWARAKGARRFVFLSSSGVFGVATGPDPVDEGARASATDPYSAAKRAGEILLSGAAEPGFETLSLRLGPVFGPHEAARPTRPTLSPVARMIAAARATGEIMVTTPDARRDWTYLPDIARAVTLMLGQTGPLPPLLHLTSGRAVSDLELAQAIADRLPGTRVRATPDAGGHGARPAMVSRVASPLDSFDWTPLEMALEALLPSEAPA